VKAKLMEERKQFLKAAVLAIVQETDLRHDATNASAGKHLSCAP
jgi:hypothetical protein